MIITIIVILKGFKKLMCIFCLIYSSLAQEQMNIVYVRATSDTIFEYVWEN